MMYPALLAPLFGALAYAHTTFTNIYVDGVDQGAGNCMRMNRYFQNTTFPVSPITSPEIACGMFCFLPTL